MNKSSCTYDIITGLPLKNKTVVKIPDQKPTFLHTVISGYNLHKYKGKYFYKILSNNMIHHGFQWKIGLNINTEEFYPYGECDRGGLYFTDSANLSRYINFGNKIGILTVPDDARIWVEQHKFKAEKVVLLSVIESEQQIFQLFKESLEMLKKNNQLSDFELFEDELDFTDSMNQRIISLVDKLCIC